MKIDWYTKGVLTVIAVALIGIGVQNYMSAAAAQETVYVDGGFINCYVSNARDQLLNDKYIKQSEFGAS